MNILTTKKNEGLSILLLFIQLNSMATWCFHEFMWFNAYLCVCVCD